jgi:hypothetical protein
VIEAAGVDTWSVCWYVKDQSAACKAMETLATERGPRSQLLPEVVEGHRVGWFPGSRMLFAEGRPGGEHLCRADALPAVVHGLAEALAARGILLPGHRLTRPEGRAGDGFGGVRRLDSTVNLAFDNSAEGLAVLAGVAALPIPRCKTQVVREVGGRRVETVYFRGSSGKRVLGRWYDKGIEAGTAKRGMLVRPEDQRRFPKQARVDVETIAATTYVRDAFVRRFEPLWRASKGVKVSGWTGLAQRLGELVDEGELSAGEAKAIAGYLLLEEADANRQSERQRYRDRSRCRNHGLVLADGVLDEVEVDLGDVLEQALDSAAWGVQG